MISANTTSISELSKKVPSSVDYSNPTEISPDIDTTMTTDGVICGELSCAHSGFIHVYINGVVVEQQGAETNQRCRGSFYAQVSKGDVVKVETYAQSEVILCQFFPYKY